MSFKKERIDIEIIEHLGTYYKVKIGTIEVRIQESDLEIAKKEVIIDKKLEEAYREKMARERKQLYTWDEVETLVREAFDEYNSPW